MEFKASSLGIKWFKTNLRTTSNPLLEICHKKSDYVDHLYVFDPRNFQTVVTNLGKETDHSHKCNFLRFKFLCESVNDLHSSLQRKGSTLNMYLGYPEEVIPAFIGAKEDSLRTALYCQEETTSEEKYVSQQVYKKMECIDVDVKEEWSGETLINFKGPALMNICDELGHFTAFRKDIEGSGYFERANILESPDSEFDFKRPRSQIADLIRPVTLGHDHFTLLDNFDDLVTELWDEIGKSTSSTSGNFTSEESELKKENVGISLTGSAFPFRGGEAAALDRLRYYVNPDQGDSSLICSYKQTRNGLVGSDYSTKFSPYLALGCISPRSIASSIYSFEDITSIRTDSTYFIIFELLWRDYMRLYGRRWGNKLFHLGGPQGDGGRQKHAWGRSKRMWDAWRAGRTGYPFIDANMRELAASGFMSNRGRQVVASFLVRDLGLDWRLGAMHFESCLLDHDVCSNYGNWQYSAGVGSDPRDDRYFNIIKQTKMYDPSCAFIRLWLPEIAHLPDAYLADSRLLTPDLREEYGLNDDSGQCLYPPPIVDLLHGFFDENKANKALSKKQRAKKTSHGDIPGIRPPPPVDQANQSTDIV